VKPLRTAGDQVAVPAADVPARLAALAQ